MIKLGLSLDDTEEIKPHTVNTTETKSEGESLMEQVD